MKLMRTGFGKGLRCAVVVLALCMFEAKAYEEEFDLNALIVRSEMYVWNRISDFLDIFHGGIAGGPGIGFEVALTDYAKLGAYVSYERGVDFPHFLPPLWLIDYYARRPIFHFHEGYYATASFGPWRKQIYGADATMYFPRGEIKDNVIWADTTSPWDIRLQIDALLIHPYINVRGLEVADFLPALLVLIRRKTIRNAMTKNWPAVFLPTNSAAASATSRSVFSKFRSTSFASRTKKATCPASAKASVSVCGASSAAKSSVSSNW